MPKPFVIGLTGSIGMGKSETAKLFAAEGMPVHDADAIYRQALWQRRRGGCDDLRAPFPARFRTAWSIVRALSALVLNDKAALEKLEGLVHPLVAAERDAFLRNADGARLCCSMFRCCSRPARNAKWMRSWWPARRKRCSGPGCWPGPA